MLPCTIFAHKFRKNARNYLPNRRNCCNLRVFTMHRDHYQGEIPQHARQRQQRNAEKRHRLRAVTRPPSAEEQP